MSLKKTMIVIFVLFLIMMNHPFSLSYAETGNQEYLDVFEMSLEELLDTQVVSASKVSESLKDSPVNMMVITGQEIRERGYLDLSEIFDDIPGMDVSRAYGSTYFKNYMRGFRSYSGAYYLLMVDGVEFNNLYNGDEWIMSAFPLSNIERVEIVYGPSSSIFGVNALMGVVNIITVKNRTQDGTSLYGKVGSSGDSYWNADLNLFCQLKDMSISVTGRMENFDLRDRIDNNSYEWTKDQYFNDPRLWGNLLNNPSLGGKFSSINSNKGLDVRLLVHDSEIAFQYYIVDQGGGLVSPGDQIQCMSKNPMNELSLSLKHSQVLIKGLLNAKTLCRYRRSDWTPDSPFIYASPHVESDSQGNQTVDLTQRDVSITYYQSLNSSFSFFQDFEITLRENLSFVSGFKYERKDLSKSWESASGPVVNVNEFDPLTYAYPGAIAGYQVNNRVIWRDFGGYLQGHWAYLKNHSLVYGFRVDHNNEYGTVATMRGSLVSHFKRFTLRVMAGEGRQEPSSRLHYGNWNFAGSSSTLKPTRSRTFEVKWSYVEPSFSADLSCYYVNTRNSWLQFEGGAKNIGRKNIWGLDFTIKALITPPLVRNMLVWGTYSYTSARGDEALVTDASGRSVFEWGELGDIADHKVYAGTTINISKQTSITFLSRYVGKRKTIYSNPIDTINGYFLVDANIMVRNLFHSGVGLALKINNIGNVKYFHPGHAVASSGNVPGTWVNGEWHGSMGYYNSLLPQQVRTITLSLILEK